MNGLVEIVVICSIIAAGHFPHKVHSETDYFEHAQPSQHVMHIRKLSDSDKLKIELEPVWFHVESTEQKPSSESQQVKRQTRDDFMRPLQIFPSVEKLAAHQKRNNDHVSKSEASTNDSPESFLKNFWHVDNPNGLSNRELSKKSTSVEEYLENTNLPSCFRKYLHEMYDRNHESVQKLMRCLTQQSTESCNAARRSQRVQPNYFSSQEDDFYPKNDPERRLHERKVIRKRKYNEQHDASSEQSANDDLKFEQLFIRSDSDYGGQIFEPVTDVDAESSSDESSSSSDIQSRDHDTKSRESNESEPRERSYGGRERPIAYRRLPQKYNTQTRHHSDESEQDCSCEESGESCEHC
uniref:Uncharacterized protein n=1 Tax=Anopheles farauti TaxID=69004 RepID=A0A182Q930_9DIPT